MKNLFKAFAMIAMVAAFASCGDDDDDDDDSTSCEQTDFVGSYKIVGDTICSVDNTVTAPETFFLTAGATETAVLENGEEDLILTIVECKASDEFVSYTIEGDKLVSQIGECSWTYEKN